MKVSAYYRVSSEEQRQRQSILSQQAPVQQYIRSVLNSEPVTEYPDDGVTSSIPLEKRDAGRRMLDDAKAGVFDTLVIWRLNRICRGGIGDTLGVLKMLNSMGVRVISLHEQIDTGTALGEMLVAVSAFAGRIEKENIRGNAISGQIRVAKEGKWVAGTPPFGYRVNKETGRLEEDVDQAKIVRDIFALYLTGYSILGVAEVMNGRGVPPPSHWNAKHRGIKAIQWNDTQVTHILQRECYTGVYDYRKVAAVRNQDGERSLKKRNSDEWITFSIPVIISPSDFETVQQLKEQRTNRKKHSDSYNFKLRGMVRCGECGYATRTDCKFPTGKKLYPYYRCNSNNGNRVSHVQCSNPPMRADVLEDWVKWVIKEATLHPNRFLATAGERLETNSKKAEELRKELVRIDTRLAEIETERKTLIRLLTKELITEDEGETNLDALKNEAAKLLGVRNGLESQAERIGADDEQIRQVSVLLHSIRYRIENLEDDEWRWVIPVFVKRIDVFAPDENKERTFLVDFCVPPEQLFKLMPNGRMVEFTTTGEVVAEVGEALCSGDSKPRRSMWPKACDIASASVRPVE